MIKNLSQFKKAMVVGSKWKFIDSRSGNTETIRECTISQTNSFALNNHPNMKDKTLNSWLEYPRAKDVIFIQERGENTKVRINLSQEDYLIYQQID